MPYQVKILKVADCKEWQPNPSNMDGAAGPNIKGAWLATPVSIETLITDSTGNVLEVYERKDLFVPEPYSVDQLTITVNLYKSTLPTRSDDEGLVFPDPISPEINTRVNTLETITDKLVTILVNKGLYIEQT